MKDINELVDETLWLEYLMALEDVGKAEEAIRKYHVVVDEPDPDPTPVPDPTPIPTPSDVGIAVAGLEFAENKLPGKEGEQYKSNGLQEYKRLADKGFKLFRVPFISERFSPEYLGYIQDNVNHAKAVGGKVWLDFHDYGRGIPAKKDKILDIARQYKDDDTVEAVEIDNEPHSGHIAKGAWYTWAELMVEELRDAGWDKIIGVPLYHWSALDQFADTQANAPSSYLKDDKVRYVLHNYFNKSNTGFDHTPKPDQGPEVDANRLEKAARIFRGYGVKVAVTEFGTPSSPEWVDMMTPFLKVLAENTDVYTHSFYWAAGEWYASQTKLEDSHMNVLTQGKLQ